MALLFEWDPKKARSNIAKHGVSFDEASTAFRETLSVTISDPLHSEDEDRFVLLGYSYRNKLTGSCPYRTRQPGSHYQCATGDEKREDTL